MERAPYFQCSFRSSEGEQHDLLGPQRPRMSGSRSASAVLKSVGVVIRYSAGDIARCPLGAVLHGLAGISWGISPSV